MKSTSVGVLLYFALSGCNSDDSCNSLVGTWRVNEVYEYPSTSAEAPGAIVLSSPSNLSGLDISNNLTFSSQGLLQSKVLDHVVNYQIENDSTLVLKSEWNGNVIQDGLSTDGILESLRIRRGSCNSIQLCRFEINGTVPWLDLIRYE